jgi:D-proline reductase (dithiol) PrdB
VGLIQRVLDDAGLCTLSITQNMEITAIIMPSRALYVGHPFGLTFGALGDRETQRAVLAEMLAAAATMDRRGIRDSGFEWEWDDLRHRQLRKQRR